MKHGKIIPNKRPDIAQSLAETADKCEAAGERDVAARMRKLSKDMAYEQSPGQRHNWSLFKPFRDNKPWRRLLSIAVGAAFVAWGLVSLSAGHITVGRDIARTYSVASEPVDFWIVIVIVLSLGAACIYRGIRGKR